MKFDISGDLNPGAWFDIVEDKPEEGRLCLRIIPEGELKKIADQTTKKKVEYKKGQRFEVLNTNDDKYDELFWDYVIEDWETIQDAVGNDIPCNAKNKVALVTGSIDFKRAIDRCLERLKREIEDRNKAIEKNSSSTSNES